MKKGLIIFTAVCAIITGISLVSCSTMLEDLRKARNKKNQDNNTEYTEGMLKTVPGSKKKTNKVKIIIELGEEEIKKTGYVFSEPDTEKKWINAEDVLTDSSFTEITKDSNGKYIITAPKNGDYTVAVKDKDGNKKYETVKVDNIISVDVDSTTVSINKKGEPFDVIITGLNIVAEDFDADAFSVVCKDNSENEVSKVTDGAVFTRNDDGSVKVTLKIPENKGEYEITIECNTKEYGDVYLTGTLSVDIIYYNVKFDTDGAGTVEVQNVEEGTKAQKPDDPIKTSGDDNLYEFQGWYDENGMVYDFSKPVNTDKNLKAKWNKITIMSGYTGEKKIFGSWPQSETNITDSNLTPTGKKYDGKNEEYKDADNNYYVKVGKTYFKVEPIEWRVIATYSDGRKLLLADKIYTNLAYYGTRSERKLNDTTIYPNNYKYSNIRAYLNSTKNQFEIDGGSPIENVDVDWTDKGFLTSAFTSNELKIIKPTAVDNSVATTGYVANKYVCGNTEDMVFLLSYEEVQKELYGLNNEEARIRAVTDYAKSNGAYQYDVGGEWWLRSPRNGNSGFVHYIFNDGNLDGYTVTRNYVGSIPALFVME